MRIQEVVSRAMSGQLSWLQAAEIIGVTPRQMRRWRARNAAYGYDGLLDLRCRRPSDKKVPGAVVEQVLQLYREQYFDFNVRHFQEVLVREHAITLSYSWVKAALQTAGLVARARKRGPHRRRREQRPLPGMLLHIDASRHAWIPDGLQDLVSVSDDATNELYYARLVPEETTRTVLEALRDVVATQGRFGALYTDRSSHFIHTPKPEQPRHRTQVERALEQLGIELIAAHSPQARGRKERLYGTLQGRWPQELRVAGITTLAAANTWLTREGIARYNRRFAVPAPQAGTAFVPAPADLAHIFSVQQGRIVSNANTVQLGRRVFQILPSRLRCHFVRCHVTVHEQLDGTYSITYGRTSSGAMPPTASRCHSRLRRNHGDCHSRRPDRSHAATSGHLDVLTTDPAMCDRR